MAELARLGRVSRTRIRQVMDLLMMQPLSLAKTRSDSCRLHECSIGAVDCDLPALVHLALDGSPRCDRGPIQHEGLVHLRRPIARGSVPWRSPGP